MSFEAAGKRIGSLAVNLIRLVIAFFFLAAFGWIVRGLPLPTDATAHNWIWLLLSGLVGFTIGDLTLFRAFVLIGSRVSMLIMALVPPITAIFGWLLMGEVLGLQDWGGMLLTVAGVAMVILERKKDENGVAIRLAPAGVLLAFLGAFGQAGGLVLSKYGMAQYNPFAATQIRVIAGIVGFSVIFMFIGWWPRVFEGVRNKSAMKRVSLGAFFGPFLGVSLSLMAVQHAKAGVAATIMALTPVLIIAPTRIVFKEKISRTSIIGALIAVSGVALLILT